MEKNPYLYFKPQSAFSDISCGLSVSWDVNRGVGWGGDGHIINYPNRTFVRVSELLLIMVE